MPITAPDGAPPSARGIAGEEDAALMVPQERCLPRGMARRVNRADASGDVQFQAVDHLAIHAGRVRSGVAEPHEERPQGPPGEPLAIGARRRPLSPDDGRIGGMDVDGGPGERDQVCQAAHVVAVVVRDQDGFDVVRGVAERPARGHHARGSLWEAGIDEDQAVSILDRVRVDVPLQDAMQPRNDLLHRHGPGGYRMGR
jgi:hypothetical protein